MKSILKAAVWRMLFELQWHFSLLCPGRLMPITPAGRRIFRRLMNWASK